MKLTLCYVDQTVNATHIVLLQIRSPPSLSLHYFHSSNDDRTKKRKHNTLYTHFVHITMQYVIENNCQNAIIKIVCDPYRSLLKAVTNPN